MALLCSATAACCSNAAAEQLTVPRLVTAGLFDQRLRDGKSGDDHVFRVEATGTNNDDCATHAAQRDRQTPQFSICPDANTTQSIRLSTKGLETAVGRLAVHGAMGKSTTPYAMTMARIANPAFDWRETNTAAAVGFANSILDGRVSFNTDLAWSQETSSWQNLDGGEASLFTSDRTGAARWHRLELRLIDTPELRWTAVGETASVDEDFAANGGGRPKRTVTLPGDRTRLWSRLSTGDLSLTATQDRLASRFQDRQTERVKVEWDGLTIGASAYRIARMSPSDPSRAVSLEETAAISLEVMPETLLPALVAGSGLLLPLVPEIMSFDVEVGKASDPSDPANGERLRDMQALLTWSGRLGQTTALFWRNDAEPERDAQATRAFEQLVDISHSVASGPLRIGLGATAFNISERGHDGASFADTNVSASFSLSYAPARGPKVDLRLGHSRDEIALGGVEDRWDQRSLSHNVSGTIDLSHYLQSQLDRPDLSLKAEYRRNLGDQRVSEAPIKEYDTESFLMWFRMQM